jgi:hypothetical protein
MIQKILNTAWLEGTDKKPPRPDLALLRHFTYREAHLTEIGVFLGFTIAVYLAVGNKGAAIGALAILRRKLQDKDQEESHQDALAGYALDGWYMAIGAVLGFLVAAPIAFFL